MTIFRFSPVLGALLASVALTACQSEQRTVAEIIASDLRDDALVEVFTDRVLALSGHKERLVAELGAAGFRISADSRPSCERWIYAAVPENEDSLRAFVSFCDDRDGGVELRRMQITQGPLGTPT